MFMKLMKHLQYINIELQYMEDQRQFYLKLDRYQMCYLVKNS